MGRPLVSACAAIGLLTGVAGVSRAQDLPYDNYLVGERALGLGGAFVGLADDPSATFHNPAGLAFLPEVSLSTSFWLVAWRDRYVAGGWRTGQGVADLGDSAVFSPPLVVTAVARIGPRDGRGLKHHAVGAAVLKPLRDDFRLAASLGDADTLASLDVIHRDSARWYGVSYAYGPTERDLSLGVTGFLALRSINHEEFELHGEQGAPAPSPAGYAIARHSLFAASVRHLVLRFGVAYNQAHRWRLGAMLQVPGIRLHSSAGNRETTYDIGPTGESVASTTLHEGMTARRPIPWELRVGATYFPGARTLITGDISVHSGAGSATSPIALVDRADVPRPRFLVMETHLDPSVRAAVGAEFMATQRMPVRAGLFGYRSGVPDVPAQRGVVSASDLHTVGASLSVGVILGDGNELSFGAAGIHSFGTGAALDQSAPDETSYVATSASETQVLVFIAGGRRAAKRFAKKLARQSEQWLRR